MYILPLIDQNQLIAIALQSEKFNYISSEQANTKRMLEWLKDRTAEEKKFIFFNLENLLKLNAIAIAHGVDISSISKGEVVGITQFVYSIARLQSIVHGSPTVYKFAELLNYPRAGKLVKHPHLLLEMKEKELASQLQELVDAMGYIYETLLGYIVAGKEIRKKHIFW